MRTTTRTLAINAAFLREIKEDNQQLRSLLKRTLAMLSQDIVPDHPKSLVETLAKLRDQLATHFSLEEAFGYIDDALVEAPQLSNQADVLRNQHKTLFLEICEIADDAEKLLYHEWSNDIRPIASSFRDFQRKLADHEECENELIMQSLYEDIGVGD